MMDGYKQVTTVIPFQHLERAGFSSEQIAGLFRARALYLRGVYHEDTPEYRRLAFVRWLYLNGRLKS